MSLEAALEANTKALLENREVSLQLLAATNTLIELRSNAIETVKGAAAPAGKASDKKPTASTEAKPEITTNPEDRKDPAQGEGAGDGPSPHDAVKAKMAEYMAVPDKDQRLARKAKLTEMFGKIAAKAKKEVKVHTDIPADMIKITLSTIEKLIAAGDVPVAAPEEEDLMG